MLHNLRVSGHAPEAVAIKHIFNTSLKTQQWRSWGDFSPSAAGLLSSEIAPVFTPSSSEVLQE